MYTEWPSLNTKASWSAGRSLSHEAAFLSPFEKFLRNTRKVPATGATPSHWPGRNRPIELGCNHTHAPAQARTSTRTHTNPHSGPATSLLSPELHRSSHKNTVIDLPANQQHSLQHFSNRTSIHSPTRTYTHTHARTLPAHQII